MPSTSRSPIIPVDACPLCQSGGPLRESHIIPGFVFDRLVESSATGYIRDGRVPNLRVQDGLKQPLLCDRCEGLLSAWESETARSVFRPYHRDTSAVMPYGPWLAKFCASVCWRVLFIFRGLGINNFSNDQNTLANEALRTWSHFMHDRAPNPGTFELHLLPIDLIADTTCSDLPPNLNRYLVRAIEMDAVSSNKSAFVYAKLCKLILVGFVQMPRPREWVGTRVAIKHGVIRPKHRGLPGGFEQYLADRARNMGALQATISARQKDKISTTMRADLDRAAASESFEAMSYDVAMFGKAAFDDPEE
jgi:hypothetical protein